MRLKHTQSMHKIARKKTMTHKIHKYHNLYKLFNIKRTQMNKDNSQEKASKKWKYIKFPLPSVCGYNRRHKLKLLQTQFYKDY